MEHCRTIAKFIILSMLIALTCSASIIDSASSEENSPNIIEDIIPDAENSTQKVIRVNTLDLPPVTSAEKNISESSLYNIQSLLPPNYVSTRKFRKLKNSSKSDDSPIFRHAPEQKFRKPKRPKQHQLHMIYDQPGYDGASVAKRMKVRIAPGAYPIHYIVAKTNGVFRKQPIKGFRNKYELDKYFDKAEKIGKFNTIRS